MAIPRARRRVNKTFATEALKSLARRVVSGEVSPAQQGVCYAEVLGNSLFKIASHVGTTKATMQTLAELVYFAYQAGFVAGAQLGGAAAQGAPIGAGAGQGEAGQTWPEDETLEIDGQEIGITEIDAQP